MKKIYQKTTYTSPEVEILVVRSGDVIMTSQIEGNGFTTPSATVDDKSDENWWN